MPRKSNKLNSALETHTLDAAGQSFGRLATQIARLLQGKHRPEYSPEADVPIIVKVQNVGSIKITGRKAEQKIYYRHTGYPGHLKGVSLQYFLESKPRVIVYKAVENMLPKNRLRSRRLNRLLFI